MKRGRKKTDKYPGDPYYQPGRHNDGKTAAAYEGVPTLPPSVTLDEIAAEHWDHVLATVPSHVLSAADGPTLASMCQWFSQYCRLMELYQADPADASLGRQVKSAWDAYYSAACQFGMVPEKRQKLKLPPKADEGDDPMAKALGVVS